MSDGLTPELLVYGFTTAGDPQISPDGRSIVYTCTQIDEQTRKATSHLWVCDVDGSNKRQVTWSGRTNLGARWSPDGSKIAFVSDRSGGAGLFVMPARWAGDAREVARHRAGVGDLAWSPDGRSIAYTAPFDPENPDDVEPDPEAPPRVRVTRRIDYKKDGAGYLGEKRSQVFVVDVESGERRQLTHGGTDHVAPRWSPNGKTVALCVVSRNGVNFRLALVDVESGEVNVVTPDEGVVELWSWSPDGARLLYAGDTAPTGQSDFFVFDVASATTTRLTDDLQVVPAGGFYGMTGPHMPVWLDDHRALFGALRAGASGLYTISLPDGAVEKLHGWDATLTGLSVDDAKHYVVQGLTSFNAYGEISVYDATAQTARVITDYSQAIFARHPPAQWERIEVQRGKFAIEAWLMKPADFDPSRTYPVVLDVHGGPHLSFGHIFYPIHQVLATNGFLVVASNPRGSNSYGREFTQQVIRDLGGEDFKDLMAVMDEVSERPYVDSQRIGISGYSYGGFMTSWTIGQTSRFQACVCGAPFYDMESFFGTSDVGCSFGAQMFGGAPHENTEWYATHSPSNFAHRATTPTLILHGEADERCPIGQGEQLFITLKKAGCEVEFVRYPGASHLFLLDGEPAYREDLLRRTLAWFKDHLGEPVETKG